MSAKGGDEGMESTRNAGPSEGEGHGSGQMLEIAFINLRKVILTGADH
jgi:hypothetical protein